MVRVRVLAGASDVVATEALGIILQLAGLFVIATEPSILAVEPPAAWWMHVVVGAGFTVIEANDAEAFAFFERLRFLPGVCVQIVIVATDASGVCCCCCGIDCCCD